MSPHRSQPPDDHDPRRPGSPEELELDRALSRWASRPPRTPAETAARRIESRLPTRRRFARRLAGLFAGASAGRSNRIDRAGQAGRRRRSPWLAPGTAALAASVAIILALVLGWAVLRGGFGPLSPSEQARSTPPDAVPRAAEVVPSPGASDDVLVLDLDERTTLYLDLASRHDWGSSPDLGGT